MKLFQYNKDDVKKTLDMAWPAILESFFAAFAGLVDSLMVSSMGSYAVAAVGLTTQPKFVGLSLFIAANVSISALVATPGKLLCPFPGRSLFCFRLH